MKKYKELYFEQKEKTEYWIRKYEEILAEKQKEVEPYCVDLYFDKSGENIAHIENVVKHEVEYKRYPDCSPENWKITTEDGLVSVFKYDEVKYILAYRKGKNEQRYKNNLEKHWRFKTV